MPTFPNQKTSIYVYTSKEHSNFNVNIKEQKNIIQSATHNNFITTY